MKQELLEVVTTDQYQSLVEECKSIITEGLFRARQEVIDTWKMVGDRIIDDLLYKSYGNKGLIEKVANDLGKSNQTIYYAIQFAKSLRDKNSKVSNALESNKNLSWFKVINEYLPKPKENKVVSFPKGKYQVIYADPPWDVKAGPGWASGEESRDLIYPTLSIEQVKNMRIRDIVDDNAHLYLWVINKYIYESYEIARAWGFEPSALLTWIKPPHGIGLGGTFVQTTEHLLFCRRGILEAKKRIDTTWFKYPRGKHSEKPDEFRKMIEEVSPGNRIELFAREKVRDWEVWGNEI